MAAVGAGAGTCTICRHATSPTSKSAGGSTVAAINDVLTAVEDAEDDDPGEASDVDEDDDPSGDVLDRGEADNADDEDDGTAEHDSRDHFGPPMCSGTLDSFHPSLNRHVVRGAEHLPTPKQAQALADDTGEPVLARSGLMYKPRERVAGAGA